MTAARVLITGFDGIDETGPGFSVARALKAGLGDDVSCTALIMDSDVPAAWMDNAIDRILLCRNWHSEARGVVDQLLAEARTQPVSALIPGSTLDASAFVEFKDDFADAGIGLFLPGSEALRRLTRRDDLEASFESVNIGMPSAATFTTAGEMSRAAPLLAYPVVVSIGAQRRVTRGISDLKALTELEPPSPDRPAIVSTMAAGDPYRLACLAENGVLGPTVVARVVGMTRQGGVAAASVVHDPDIAKVARQAVAALNWTGPLELELLRRTTGEKAETEILITDVQCRLPAWAMLCHWCGTNLAAALLHRLREGTLPTLSAPRPGTMFVRSNRENTVPVDCYRKLRAFGSLPLPRVASGNRRSSDDPGVAVTGLSASDVINPGLGVARALARAQTPISLVGLGYAVFDAGAYEPGLFDRVYRLDYPTSATQQLDRITQLNHGSRIDALIPCLDGEIEFFAENASALERLGISTLLPTPAAFRRRSKLALSGSESKRDWGRFSIPRSTVVEKESAVMQAVRDLGLPVVMKGADFGCLPIESVADARHAWAALTGHDENKVIIQERLSGPSYAVSVVCDRNHDPVSALTIKKKALCRRGSTWSGISVNQPELERSFAEYLKSIEWVGPAEGEFIRNSETGQFYLFEVNPRFTGWISCAPGMGANQPEIVARLALSLPVQPSAPQQAAIFMRAPDEVRVPATRLSTFTTQRMIRHENALAV